MPHRAQIEASPATVRRLVELEERKRANAGLVFRNRWRCDDPNCEKGLPHGRWTQRHARGAQVVLDMPTRIVFIRGGRASGKTLSGAGNFGELILTTEPDEGDDHTEWALIGPTFREARRVGVEGPSGLRSMLDGFVEKWNRSEGVLTLTTGAVIYCDGANDGGERIEGLNLYGALLEEVGNWRSWEQAWNRALMFATRKGPARIIATGTPRRASLAKVLIDDPEVDERRLLTKDNIHNLSEKVVEELYRRYQGTTLGRQELEGLLLEDVEGALWSRGLIDTYRVDEHVPGFWTRKVVGLDPADGTEDGDYQGLAVVGLSAETHELYVLESEGYKLDPWEFLRTAVDVAQRHEATIVMEKNYGGRFATTMLQQVMRDKGVMVPYTTVHAKDGKRTRAEPVAGLYEMGRVHHVGHFPELEDELCVWTGLPKDRQPSPDRLDALVMACTQFIGYDLGLHVETSDTLRGALAYSDEPVTGGAVAWS